MAETLALNGGMAVRTRSSWPAWPQWDELTCERAVEVLRSSRWTISWPSQGKTAVERAFADAFAQYNSSPYCVAVDHGSSALVVALESLDIGPGDEVIVPVMTWVASASAVLRVGALPVLVDVDAATGCIRADVVREAVTTKTKAVIAVHLACTTADLDELRKVVDEQGVGLIEDCAQAHGAVWRGRKVGTVGDVGTFSFQQGKVLASGEGGSVLTGSQRLYERMQQLRADSRLYARPQGGVCAGFREIIPAVGTMGVNYCMSEVQAAILLDQLPRLDAQHELREARAAELMKGLSDLGKFSEIPTPAECKRRSIYEYGIRFGEDEFGESTVEQVSYALSAELARPVYPPDLPLYRSVYFRPRSNRHFAAVWTEEGQAHSLGRSYEGAEAYRSSTLLIHHSALLGNSEDIADIVRAVAKVKRLSKEVTRLDAPLIE